MTPLDFRLKALAVVSGSGSAWQSTWFGSKGSQVQILSSRSRPQKVLEILELSAVFFLPKLNGTTSVKSPSSFRIDSTMQSPFVALVVAALLAAATPDTTQTSESESATPLVTAPKTAGGNSKAPSATRNTAKASPNTSATEPAILAKATERGAEAKPPIPVSSIQSPSQPPTTSKIKPAIVGKNTALAKDIEQIVAETPLEKGRLSVEVISLDTGKVIYGRNANELLNPASNAKLFTSAAALAILSPGFRFETEFIFDTDPHKPTTDGGKNSKNSKARRKPKQNLYVRGGGDPTLTSEELWGIVGELYDRGLRIITGDIVLDESFFDNDLVGVGFDQENSDRAYMAPPASLSLNWNAIGVHIWPGNKVGSKAFVAVNPESDFIVVDNRIKTRSRRSIRRLTVATIPENNGQKQRVLASGRLPIGSGEVHTWRKIDDPGLYFGHTLKRFLSMRGISVKGTIRRGTAPTANTGDIGPITLVLHRSRTLDSVLKHVNKNSSNIVAEALVKTLGAKVYGTPGTWKTGLYAIERYLDAEVGLNPGTYVMKNGSGLNDVNRFSTHQINQLLLAMWRRFPTSPEFMSSLGIAGHDGTVQFRMADTPAAGRLRAKTGTLENVSALSGYVQNIGGDKWAFSIVANDFPGRAGKIVPLLDAIGAAIAGQGNPKSKSASQSNLTGVLTPLDQLGKKIEAANALISTKDAKKIRELFTKISRERDPAIRALIADCLVQMAPDNSDAAGAFLRHFNTNKDVFGRLMKAATLASMPLPLIQSLAQLASDGHQEALTHLIQITAEDNDAYAFGDGWLSEAQTAAQASLVEVAFIVPQAVFYALKSIEDADRQNQAVERLFQGIAKAEKSATTALNLPVSPQKNSRFMPSDRADMAGQANKTDRDTSDVPNAVSPHPFSTLVKEKLKDGKTQLTGNFEAALRRAIKIYSSNHSNFEAQKDSRQELSSAEKSSKKKSAATFSESPRTSTIPSPSPTKK